MACSYDVLYLCCYKVRRVLRPGGIFGTHSGGDACISGEMKDGCHHSSYRIEMLCCDVVL